jgi:hypothetical protein
MTSAILAEISSDSRLRFFRGRLLALAKQRPFVAIKR